MPLVIYLSLETHHICFPISRRVLTAAGLPVGFDPNMFQLTELYTSSSPSISLYFLFIVTLPLQSIEPCRFLSSLLNHFFPSSTLTRPSTIVVVLLQLASIAPTRCSAFYSLTNKCTLNMEEPAFSNIVAKATKNVVVYIHQTTEAECEKTHTFKTNSLLQSETNSPERKKQKKYLLNE